jgi:hypothetical protein
MNQLALLKRYYKEVDPQILAQYRDAEKSVWVNTEDKDLIPIEISLPQPPEPHLIDNFGLPAHEQMWHIPELPKRLKELQIKLETLDQIWDELESNKDIYSDEIEFIRVQWERRFYGYWFYNNGVPTYIDGWHYFYCAWWKIDVGLPIYRDRDRRFFLFARYIFNETKAPRVNNEGFAIKDEKGKYIWVDFGRRLFYGFNYPKHRREGATYKAECIQYEIISRTLGAFGGIQSMNEKQGKKCFLRHLVAPWKKLPFFFKPNYEGTTSPKSELSFTPPAIRLSSRGSLSNAELGLESGISFDMADASAYDGDKLFFHHDDEVGKLQKGLSCWDRHTVVKECLVIGSKIIGFTIKTSTVGEMEKGGGKWFKYQCKMSRFYERNQNGQTKSGLAILFIPAYDGLEGFIDKFGMSIVDAPTKEQSAYIEYDKIESANRNSTKVINTLIKSNIEYVKKQIGAKEYLQNRRRALTEDQDSLSEEIRLYPTRFTECFRTAVKSSGFNMNKVENYIDNLSMSKQPIITGNFSWKDNIRDSTVIFKENPQGKFRLSHQFEDNEANRKLWSEEEECWKPGNTTWGVAGGDPFKFNKTEGNRKSKGGGAVVRKGKIQDGNFAMKRKFVCTYAQRTFDKNLYGEDMLMMCIYYGVQMFPEINVPFLWDYFEERGYGGYLLYKVDPKSFEFSKTPGGLSSEKIKQDIFTEYMTWIENEADIENHVEVLEECRDIDGPEDMTNYDLFTAGGYALLGTHGIYDEVAQLNEKDYTLDSYLQQRSYSFSRIH